MPLQVEAERAEDKAEVEPSHTGPATPRAKPPGIRVQTREQGKEERLLAWQSPLELQQ